MDLSRRAPSLAPSLSTVALLALCAQGCFGLGLTRKPLPEPAEAGPDVAVPDAPEVDMGPPDVVLPPCPAGQTRCGTSCFDVQNDTFNCGTCGNMCPTAGMVPAASVSCSMGRCQPVCLPGTANCDGDPLNGCEAMLTQSDNCAICGNNCATQTPFRNVQTLTCNRTLSACGYAGCVAGYQDCNGYMGDGCETNVRTDPQNCNACSTPCPAADNARPVCNGGMCGSECLSGFADCDGNTANGCETNVAADDTICSCDPSQSTPTRCGSGQVCVRTARAGAGADGGTGDASADASAMDGSADARVDGSAVSDVRPDVPADAGRDGGNALVFGTCMSSCPAGLTMCGRRCVDAQIDPVACGSSCSVCPGAPHAVAACTAGTCAIQCVAPFVDADGNSATGCETNGDADPMNCGAAGHVCPAGSRCVSGRCTIEELPNCQRSASRFPGNCDGDENNGCEVNMLTSTDHCGRCGNACFTDMGTRASCVSGSCNFTCNEGFLNCDTNAANGCEVNKTSDNMNCGACRNACAAGQTCRAGVCAM